MYGSALPKGTVAARNLPVRDIRNIVANLIARHVPGIFVILMVLPSAIPAVRQFLRTFPAGRSTGAPALFLPAHHAGAAPLDDSGANTPRRETARSRLD